ncbi:tail fiber domain-containing protein [Burkholderia gladioli]|uniref:tail fiber domain-containing protein n=1 Tax=Burkholderia gladioli TaxID=28095 RepID=UPI0016418B05|nr:tail fiber domain-containing protein [Burkholderia gladioli]MBU9154212.1 tail fiber domain-containing protein [Burkholderia gladioli]
MTTLQQINLGAIPDGAGGDTNRIANARTNVNMAVLDACVALGYQIVSANKTLAATDAGSRFGLVFQAASGIVVLPLANSVRQNGIVHFFNIGTQAVNIGFQGSDGAQITKVNAGDWVQYASDGNAYWHVVARGRLTLDEVFGGALTTVGAITSGGLLTAPNILATTIDASGSGGQLRAIQGGYGAILRNDGFAVYLMSTDKNNATGSFNALRPFWWNLVSGQVTIAGDGAKTTIGGALTVNGQILAPEGTVQAPGISFQNDGSPDTGLFHIGDGVIGISCNTTEVVRYSPSGATFSARPTFAGKTPWDSGNFNPANYAALNGPNNFSQRPTFAGSVAWDVANLPRPAQSQDTHTYAFAWNGANVYAYVDGTQVGALAFTSDYRIKTDIQAFDGSAAEVVKSLRPVTYRMADVAPFQASDAVELGFIAHELQAAIPSAVAGEKDGVDADGRPAFQSLRWPPVVAMLTKALQEALERIEALEARQK